MSSIFSPPKAPAVLPPVDPADAANRANTALVNQLQQGGTNADTLTRGGFGSSRGGAAAGAQVGASLPSVTGLPTH